MRVESWSLTQDEINALPPLPPTPGYYLLRGQGSARFWQQTDGLTYRTWQNTVLVHG